MNEWRGFVTLVCLSSAACSASVEPPETPANALHAEAAKVLAIHAPRYLGTGTKADALRFIRSDISSWFSVRKAATRTLVAKLEAASSGAAPGSRGIALLHADAASLFYSLARESVDAAAAATPAEMRADAQVYQAYVGALVAATLPDLDRAIAEAQKCIETAQASELQVANECRHIAHEANTLKSRRGVTLPSLDGATRL
jgi:hypothetical protein